MAENFSPNKNIKGPISCARQYKMTENSHVKSYEQIYENGQNGLI